MFNRAKRAPMLPAREDLDAVVKALASFEDRAEYTDTGLVNYVLKVGDGDQAARTNLSFYLSERNGSRFWKAALVHGWQDVGCNVADLGAIKRTAHTEALIPAAEPRAASQNNGFGSEPVGYKVAYAGGDVDYTWVFELEPYRWQNQIAAMFGSWAQKVGELDGEVRRVWVRDGRA